MMKIVLRGERPISWNRYYSGVHWAKRASMARDIHSLVRSNIYGKKIPDFDEPVHITVAAYMKGKLIDPDNVCAKLYIDGLKGLVIEDDTPEYIRAVTTMVRKDNENPRVTITII